MFGVRESIDRKAVRGERGSPEGTDTGKGGQDLSVGGGEQSSDLLIDRSDVDLQAPVPDQITSEPSSTLVGIGRRWQASTPPLHPVLRGACAQPARCSAYQRLQPWCSASERCRAGQHRLPGR
nr:hypothetical protein [Mycolicibacterium conceptionense]